MNEKYYKLKYVIEKIEEFDFVRNTKMLFLTSMQWLCVLIMLLLFYVAIEIPKDPISFTRFIDETSSFNLTLHLEFVSIIINFFKALFVFLGLSFGAIALLFYNIRKKRKLIYEIENTLREVVGSSY